MHPEELKGEMQKRNAREIKSEGYVAWLKQIWGIEAIEVALILHQSEIR